MAEENEFIWIIENFHMYSSGPGDCALRSPEISAGNPHHSNWYVELISVDGETHYTLTQANGSVVGARTCEISVVCPESKTHRVTTDGKMKHSAFVCQECCLSQGTLTLRVRLSFYDALSYKIERVEELSKNIGSLYETAYLSDITVRTNDKEFFLHKFVLSKRAPKLFEELELDVEFKDGRVKLDTISTPVLEILIQYFYSGKLSYISEEYLSEFYEIIEKYKFENASAKYLPMDSFSSICTRINTEQKNICWNVEYKKPLKDKSPLFKDFTQFQSGCLLIRTWFERYPMRCIKISIQCVSLLKEYIWLQFSFFLGKDETRLILQTSKKLRFTNATRNKISTWSVPIHQNLFKSKVCMKLTLEASSGEYSTYSVTSTPVMSKAYPSVFGMGLLRHDMSDLYHEAQKNNGHHDVTLYFGCQEDVLFAHKAVLAAWSPVFTSMFDHDMLEKERNVVNIPDISFAAGKKLLLFMYGGELADDTHAGDIELYIAADKYQISSLFKQCSELLSHYLTVNCACDVLVLADQHSDERLLLDVYQFIELYRSVIMNSSEWQSLIDINPRLIS